MLRGENAALGDEESVCGDAERRVMVKAAPTSTLVVIEADLVLELLVISFDPPSALRVRHKVRKHRVLRKVRKPVFPGCCLIGRPFDQQPLRRAHHVAQFVAVSCVYANRREARV
jgi:hypothetical protein